MCDVCVKCFFGGSLLSVSTFFPEPQQLASQGEHTHTHLLLGLI